MVLAWYSLQLAGWGRRSITAGLGLYALPGPILFALGGENAEELVARWWVLRLIPIGVSVAIVSFAALWRQRTMETGLIAGGVLVAVLRQSIDAMRVATEALASDEQDFRTVFGNFRFRWDQRLREAQVVPQWLADLPDAVFPVPPHTALQLLRIVQEALTNVLKHSGASRVGVDLKLLDGSLHIEIVDNGQGLVHAQGANHAGCGIANMQARAARLCAQLQFDVPADGGCRVMLVLPYVARPAAELANRSEQT